MREYEYKELSKKELSHIIGFLTDIYGISEEFLKEYEFIKRANDVWITTKKAITFLPYTRVGININSIGFRAMRNAFEGNAKITTNFAQLLQDEIKKNIRTLNEKELNEYIHGHDLNLKEDIKGYCVLKYKTSTIGVGQIKDGNIKNQIPKGRVLKNMI